MLLAVRISSYGCTWEVWRVLKKLELRSVAPRATLTHFPCPPNFPRASITRYTYAKHEQILNLPCACHMLISRMYRAYILLALCPSMHASQENAETTPVPLSKYKFHCLLPFHDSQGMGDPQQQQQQQQRQQQQKCFY